jgi:hypothetical protein
MILKWDVNAHHGWSETFAPSPEGPSRIPIREAILSTNRAYALQPNLIWSLVILSANQLVVLPIRLLAFTALQTKSVRDI